MNDRPTIKSIALTTVIGFNLRMKLQVGKVLPLYRNDKAVYQMIKTSEGSNGQPGLFFCLFSFFTNHIRTQIVGAESEHADH